MEVGCRFQLLPYNLRIVVEMAKKPTLGLSGSYWELNYASELSRSLFRPFMGHGGRLPISNDVVRFTHCG